MGSRRPRSPWHSEILRLYPGANVLVATKKDFETKNRKKFCARIATGDYDAIVIGHSQFEKIPLSPERQARFIEEQIEEITRGIEELKEEYKVGIITDGIDDDGVISESLRVSGIHIDGAYSEKEEIAKDFCKKYYLLNRVI